MLREYKTFIRPRQANSLGTLFNPPGALKCFWQTYMTWELESSSFCGENLFPPSLMGTVRHRWYCLRNFYSNFDVVSTFSTSLLSFSPLPFSFLP
jgi:hypothetical protein